MARACARCLVRFPGADGGRRFRWCSQDGFYVCERCWFNGCLASHAAPHDAPGPWVKAVVALVAVSVTFGSALPFLVSEYSSTAYWGTAPLRPISTLQTGEIAKVTGTIVSSDLVAYGGSIQTTCAEGCSTTWQWNWTSIFYLKDATGSIPVRVQRPWKTFPGPHLAAWGASVGGTFYARNDTIFIVGTVGALDNGTKALQVDYISPAGSDPPPDTWALGFMAIIAACLLVVWAVWGSRFISRRSRHAAAVGGRAARALQPQHLEPDSTLPWLVNHDPSFPRVGRPGKTQIAATVVFGLVISLFFLPIAAESGPLFFLFPLFVFDGCVVIALLAYAYHRLIRPAAPFAVAFTEHGLHLAYESPYARTLYDPLIAWDDVTLEQRPARHGRAEPEWLVDHIAGRAADSILLSEPNWRRFCQEWNHRAAAPRVVPSSA